MLRYNKRHGEALESFQFYIGGTTIIEHEEIEWSLIWFDSSWTHLSIEDDVNVVVVSVIVINCLYI